MAPSRRQLRVALDLVGEINDAQTVEELCELLLAALHRLVPSDYVSYNEVRPGGDAPLAVISPEVPGAVRAAWERLALTNPLVERFARTQDGRAYRFSDVVSRTALHDTELYREVYGPLGVEHQIAFAVPPSDPALVVGIALSRGGARDFDDTERAVLDLIRPHLSQAMRNVRVRTGADEALAAVHAGLELRDAAALLVDAEGLLVDATGEGRQLVRELTGEEPEVGRPLPGRLPALVAQRGAALVDAGPGVVIVRGAPTTGGGAALVLDRTGEPLPPEMVRRAGLTAREAAVLAALSAGRSVTEIAAELRVSPRTVDKHAERATRKLGARDRAHAVALAWAAAVPFSR